MTTGAIDESQQRAAKAAGLAYLLTFLIVVSVNYGIHDRLIVESNAAETAHNILAHEQLFRLGIVGDILYCVGVVIQLTALYVILRPMSQGLALLAALWRLTWVLMWLVMTLHLFDAVRLVSGADYLRGFEVDRLQSLASLNLSARFDYYYVGLLFGSLASTLCAYLWLKSRYIPRWLAIVGVITSTLCVACTLIFYVFSKFSDVVNLYWFDTPMGLFDIATSLWLVFKGLKLPEGMRFRAPAGMVAQ